MARAREDRAAAEAGPPGPPEAWTEAMDLWREDSRRRGALPPAAVLADRVLRSGRTRASDGLDERTARHAHAYAAAALLLIGVGVGGAALLGPPPSARGGEVGATLQVLERERIGQRVEQELERFSLAAPDAHRKER